MANKKTTKRKEQRAKKRALEIKPVSKSVYDSDLVIFLSEVSKTTKRAGEIIEVIVPRYNLGKSAIVEFPRVYFKDGKPIISVHEKFKQTLTLGGLTYHRVNNPEKGEFLERVEDAVQHLVSDFSSKKHVEAVYKLHIEDEQAFFDSIINNN